jgi:hypothetical protein
MRHDLEKKKSQKKAGGVAQSIGLEFKPSTTTKKKKKYNYTGAKGLVSHPQS